MNTPRDLALFLLNRQAHKFNVVDNLVEDIFRRNPGLDYRDRAFIVHLVQGVLRWRRRLDWIIEQAADFPLKKISPIVLNILRLALYQIFFMDRVPQSAAVNEAVNQAKKEGARYIVSFVNGILRNICKMKDDIDFPDPDENLTLPLCLLFLPGLVGKQMAQRVGARIYRIITLGWDPFANAKPQNKSSQAQPGSALGRRVCRA